MASITDVRSPRDNSPLSLVKGKDANIKNLTLEDGRLSFAVDSKKIYLDCDYTGPEGDSYYDRYAFGGSSGIYYGVRDFSQEEIEEQDFIFAYPSQFDPSADEVPTPDDLILNTDGCFYRVINVTEDDGAITVETKKLTIAGSGGGGSGGTSSGISVARRPGVVYTFIKSNQSIPIEVKVTDSLVGTTIDAEITINGILAGTEPNIPQGEYTTIDLYKYINYFVDNTPNTVAIRFYNEYDHAARVTITNVRIVELRTELVTSNYGVYKQRNLELQVRPYGGSAMGERFLNFRVHTPGQANVRTVTLPFDSNTDNGQIFTYTIENLVYEGNYTVDVWITAHVIAGDSLELSSNVAVASFQYRDPESTTPGLGANLSQKNFNLYDIAVISYSASNVGSSAIVRLEAWCDGTLLTSSTAAAVETISEWRVTLSRAGSYEFVIAIDAYNLEERITDVTVTDNTTGDIPTINEDTGSGLQLYLKAEGRHNSEVHPDTWEYKDVHCNFKDFNWNTNGWYTDAKNQTSLHLTNGASIEIPFAPFSMATTNNKGAQETGKTVEIIFKLTNVRNVNDIIIDIGSWNANNELFTGIVGTGDRISLSTPEIKSYLTPAQLAQLNQTQLDEYETRNNLRAYISENERVHLAYAIEPKADGTRLIYMYINGVLSGLMQYTLDAEIRDASAERPSNIRVYSDSADVDIYAIRVYGQYQSDSVLLNNYAADLPTLEERIATAADNKALSGGKISLSLVQNLNNIPYIVFTDMRGTDSKKGEYKDEAGDKHIGPNTSIRQLPVNKEDFRWAPCYFVDPEDSKHIGDANYIPRSFGSPNAPIPAVIYAQGTSSLSYPVKNLRLRFAKPEGGKQFKYSLRPAINVENLDSSDADARAKAEKEFNKWEHIPSVALFTLKADYMDSSMAHNTGTGNILTALYSDAGLKTPAQRQWPDDTIINNIVGFPCIAFWQHDDTIASAEYIGRYNFNLDKDSKDDGVVFGFSPDKSIPFGVLTDENGNLKEGFLATFDEDYDETKDYYLEPRTIVDSDTGKVVPDPTAKYLGGSSGWKNQIRLTGPLYEWQEGPVTIQCWEFLNNASPLVGFRQEYDEASDTETWDKVKKNKVSTYGKKNWCEAFESRYPLYDNECASDKRAFKRLISWLVSTDQSQATNATLDEETYGFTTDSAEYRLAKFTNEFSDYMDLDFTAFYYVLTEALLMVDSRAKNMMMCSFDVDSDAGTGHWFPIFYDMDTILGVDNSGILRFPYNVSDETERGVYNASANYGVEDNGVWRANPSYSTLWCNFRMAFKNEISSMYHTLRSKGKFSPEYFLKSFNDLQADAYAEIYSNQDGWYKYIRPLTESVTITVDGKEQQQTVDRTVAEQGTRSLHRRYFLEHRFAYLDSKYATGGDGSEDIEIHLNKNDPGRNDHPLANEFSVFHPISQSSQYISMLLEQSGSVETVELKPEVRTVTRSYAAGNFNFNDAKFYIYDLNDVYDIGDLSNKFAAYISIKYPNKLRKLKIGQAPWVDETTGELQYYRSARPLNLSGLDNCPLLEEIDARYTNFSGTGFGQGLNTLLYLHTFLAGGCNATAFNLPQGGNLREVELPASATSLILKDNLFLNNKDDASKLRVENDDYHNFARVLIDGCPDVDTYSFVEHLRASNAPMNQIRMTNIHWDLDNLTDDTAEFDVVDGVRVLKDIKALQYIANIEGGFTASQEYVGRKDTDNEYFGGEIIIHNDDFYVDDVKLKQEYGARFPYLTITYTNNEQLEAGYEINIQNAATGEKDNKQSVTIAASEAIGYNLKQHLEQDVEIPTYTSTAQFDFIFKGWSTGDHAVLEDNMTLIDEALAAGITMVQDEQSGTWTAVGASESLTAEDYTDRKYVLWPIFYKQLRQYPVHFMYTREGVTPEVEQATVYFDYGSPVTLPDNLPQVLTLDEDDKSHTTVQILNTYSYDGTNYKDWIVSKELRLYPTYHPAIDMQDVTEPPNSYFSVSAPITTSLFGNTNTFMVDDTEHPISEGIVATIKANVTTEAIVVPKRIDEQYVVSIRNESPKVKRIYFEAGCPIRYISDNAGFRNNTTLEYVDFGALTQLYMIGGPDAADAGDGTLGDPSGGVFEGCTNLYVKSLPDSVVIINKYAFRYCACAAFSKLPSSLIHIGERAFDRCTGLTYVDNTEFANILGDTTKTLRTAVRNYNAALEGDITSYLPKIGKNAFYQCSNLTFGQDNTFNRVVSIGQSAFSDCAKLVWNMTDVLQNESILFIGQSAFNSCPLLRLNRLPTTVERIDNNAFSSCGTITLSMLPKSLKQVGSKIFNGDTATENGGGNITWIVPYGKVTVDETTGVQRSPVYVANDAFSGLTMNGRSGDNDYATLRFGVEAQVDAETTQAQVDFVNGAEPWLTALTATLPGDEPNPYYAFGAKNSLGQAPRVVAEAL